MRATPHAAHTEDTRTYVYATDLGNGPVHVCGYQNRTLTRAGGNCMFLNFAGTNLKLVRGPERTRSFMRDVTAQLPELVLTKSRGRTRSLRGGGSRGVTIEDYGDYTIILAQQPEDILFALRRVPEDRRPARTRRLSEMINFYMSWCPLDSFALACFSGSAVPKHPIAVSYQPRNPKFLTIPGLDAYDGNLPRRGAPVERNFRVAFGVRGVRLPHAVNYRDAGVAGRPWAPSSVAGFVDNRKGGPNGDYVVPVDVVRRGRSGRALAKKLVAAG
jgi:hypothetical protein